MGLYIPCNINVILILLNFLHYIAPQSYEYAKKKLKAAFILERQIMTGGGTQTTTTSATVPIATVPVATVPVNNKHYTYAHLLGEWMDNVSHTVRNFACILFSYNFCSVLLLLQMLNMKPI